MDYKMYINEKHFKIWHTHFIYILISLTIEFSVRVLFLSSLFTGVVNENGNPNTNNKMQVLHIFNNKAKLYSHQFCVSKDFWFIRDF